MTMIEKMKYGHEKELLTGQIIKLLIEIDEYVTIPWHRINMQYPAAQSYDTIQP